MYNSLLHYFLTIKKTYYYQPKNYYKCSGIGEIKTGQTWIQTLAHRGQARFKINFNLTIMKLISKWAWPLCPGPTESGAQLPTELYDSRDQMMTPVWLIHSFPLMIFCPHGSTSQDFLLGRDSTCLSFRVCLGHPIIKR